VSRPVHIARRRRVTRSRPGVPRWCQRPPRLPRREHGRIGRLGVCLWYRQRRSADGKYDGDYVETKHEVLLCRSSETDSTMSIAGFQMSQLEILNLVRCVNGAFEFLLLPTCSCGNQRHTSVISDHVNNVKQFTGLTPLTAEGIEALSCGSRAFARSTVSMTLAPGSRGPWIAASSLRRPVDRVAP
jgi:hypothetical protein